MFILYAFVFVSLLFYNQATADLVSLERSLLSVRSAIDWSKTTDSSARCLSGLFFSCTHVQLSFASYVWVFFPQTKAMSQDRVRQLKIKTGVVKR